MGRNSGGEGKMDGGVEVLKEDEVFSDVFFLFDA
jgi:hypothetical protein